jgi:hypothetical protein
LDEAITSKLKQELPDHEVFTVQDMGWRAKKDAELLVLADQSFDALLTTDRNMQYQQNIAKLRRLAIVVLVVPEASMRTLRPVVSSILILLQHVAPGTATEIG